MEQTLVISKFKKDGMETARDSEDADTDIVDVVIVTYGARELVRRCLDSPELRIGAIGTVYVVDNASPDNAADVVEQEFPWVNLLRRTSNDGFAVANNVVLRTIESEYVLLLNPDARLEPGTLTHMLGVMDAEPSIGMLGCRLLTDDGTLDHAAKRMIPSLREAAAYFALRILRRTGSRYVAPDVGEFDFAEVDAINGALMLVRSSAMREVGVLDETYWMYGEDLDWCTRFRNAGWRVVYDGRVSSQHSKGGSEKIRSLRLNYAFHRSMAIYFDRYLTEDSFFRASVGRLAIWSHFAVSVVGASARRARLKFRSVA